MIVVPPNPYIAYLGSQHTALAVPSRRYAEISALVCSALVCSALVALGKHMVLTDGLCKRLDRVDKSKASAIDLQHAITNVFCGPPNCIRACRIPTSTESEA